MDAEQLNTFFAYTKIMTPNLDLDLITTFSHLSFNSE